MKQTESNSETSTQSMRTDRMCLTWIALEIRSTASLVERKTIKTYLGGAAEGVPSVIYWAKA